MDDQTPNPDSQAPPPYSSPPPPPLPPAPPPVIGSITMPPKPQSSGAGWKVLSLILFVLLVLVIFARGVNRRITARVHPTAMNRELEEVVKERHSSDKKIAVVEITGVISGGSEDPAGMDLVTYIKDEFKEAANDSDVRAVILKVDSPGGEVMASDEIYNVIKNFETEHKDKPVVVSMGSLAASGGYYVSSPCRWIVANELTLTGSIGVIMDGYNYRGLMDKVGVSPIVYKSGRFKDMMSAERELDTNKLSPQEVKDRHEEDQMVQGIITETYDKFKQVVRDGRQWAASQNGGEGHALVDNWEDVADGRVLTGKNALQLGFVDELGDFSTAVKRAEKLSGTSDDTLIEYREPFDIGSVLSHVLGKTETPAIKVDWGFDLPKLRTGCLYFMYPAAFPH